jgi:hypothetical protein
VTRCYIIATGIIFALMFVLHAVRVYVEGSWVLREPIFVLTSFLSLGVAIWAAWLIFRRPR